eukprot:TRINITY_DN112550_c0_g1_i1.p1 TRINITY_DN112550_c0_g1~~TRINITY_DN112550_c0_g1_i1.p1  ORF type:complete len:701 (+),score=125.93 TRINITY_DN112550_c0_g1_i1:211-2103(+)
MDGLTVLVPTDDALAAKIDPFTLNALFADDELLAEFVKLHIIHGTSNNPRELAWTTRESYLRPFDANAGWSAGAYGKGQMIEGYIVDGQVCVGGPGNQVTPTDMFGMNKNKAHGNMATITDTIFKDPFCTVHTIDNLLAPEKMQYCQSHSDCDGAAAYCFPMEDAKWWNCKGGLEYYSMSSLFDEDPLDLPQRHFKNEDRRCLMTCSCPPLRKTNADVQVLTADGAIQFGCGGGSSQHVLTKHDDGDVNAYTIQCRNGEWSDPEPPSCVCPSPEPDEIVEGYWWGTGVVGTEGKWVCNDGFNYQTEEPTDSAAEPDRVPTFTCNADRNIGWTIDDAVHADPAATYVPHCYPAKLCGYTELAGGFRYWSTNEEYFLDLDELDTQNIDIVYVNEDESTMNIVYRWVTSIGGAEELRFHENNMLTAQTPAGVPVLRIGSDVGPSNGILCMQDDGDLVIYDGNGDPIAHTNTAGATEAKTSDLSCLQAVGYTDYTDISDESVCKEFVPAGETDLDGDTLFDDASEKTQQDCWETCRSKQIWTYAILMTKNGGAAPSCYCSAETAAQVAARPGDTCGSNTCNGLTNIAGCSGESFADCGGTAGTVATEPQPATFARIIAGACNFAPVDCPPPAPA